MCRERQNVLESWCGDSPHKPERDVRHETEAPLAGRRARHGKSENKPNSAPQEPASQPKNLPNEPSLHASFNLSRRSKTDETNPGFTRSSQFEGPSRTMVFPVSFEPNRRNEPRRQPGRIGCKSLLSRNIGRLIAGSPMRKRTQPASIPALSQGPAQARGDRRGSVAPRLAAHNSRSYSERLSCAGLTTIVRWSTRRWLRCAADRHRESRGRHHVQASGIGSSALALWDHRRADARPRAFGAGTADRSGGAGRSRRRRGGARAARHAALPLAPREEPQAGHRAGSRLRLPRRTRHAR